MRDVGLKAVKVVYSGCQTVTIHGGWCLEVEIFVDEGILSQGASLTVLLEILGDCGIVHQLPKF